MYTHITRKFIWHQDGPIPVKCAHYGQEEKEYSNGKYIRNVQNTEWTESPNKT